MGAEGNEVETGPRLAGPGSAGPRDRRPIGRRGFTFFLLFSPREIIVREFRTYARAPSVS
jgi:hypothetical protein